MKERSVIDIERHFADQGHRVFAVLVVENAYMSGDQTAKRVQRQASDLPALNATFNLVSTIFISMGWYFIRRGAWRRHMACMITALISSLCFLVGYVTYHARVGEKSSGYTGWVTAVYFPMLASHVLLAFATLPLVILTLVPVFRRRWDRHVWIARWTVPIWLYVSVTGVLVYFMLYKWFPPANVIQAIVPDR